MKYWCTLHFYQCEYLIYCKTSDDVRKLTLQDVPSAVLICATRGKAISLQVVLHRLPFLYCSSTYSHSDCCACF